MSGLLVLEAITPSRIGGAEIFVANLCLKLPELGAEMRLFSPADRRFVGYARERGIECITWRTRGKLDPLTVIRLARLLKRGPFDVIHTHLSTASLLGAFAARLVKKPSVAHVHGLNTATCFRLSTLVIAVSEAVKRHLVAQGISAEKIRVVHDGIDLSRFNPVPLADARKRLGWDENRPVFGVFGRLSEEKGQGIAIEALYLLTRDNPSARLVIAGDGRDRADLETSAAALGISESVQFAGFVEDVASLMSACDAVIVPSLKEGMGLAAVEAMALERPVIASMVGGLSEVVDQRETGILVAPCDPRALSDAMAELIENPGFAAAMGKRGRVVAEDRFDLDKQVGAVLNVLESVVRRVDG